MSLGSNFRYEVGGNLIPIDDPTADAPEGEDLPESLSRFGFSLMLTLGDDNGLHMEIFSGNGRKPRWFLVPGDCNSFCLIEVGGWPAYLDALAHYSPIYSKPIV